MCVCIYLLIVGYGRSGSCIRCLVALLVGLVGSVRRAVSLFSCLFVCLSFGFRVSGVSFLFGLPSAAVTMFGGLLFLLLIAGSIYLL